MRDGMFRVLLAAFVAVFAGFSLTAIPALEALANGAVLPDLRLGGYSAQDIRALLDGAEAGFGEAYARSARSWDLAVPVLFALSFGWGIWRGGGIWRWLALVPVLMGLADLTENTLVTRSLLAGSAGLEPGVIAWASAATRLKWVLVGLSALLLGLSFVTRYARRNRGA